jgi:hypothetical protein
VLHPAAVGHDGLFDEARCADVTNVTGVYLQSRARALN